jgi:hypothetical protein
LKKKYGIEQNYFDDIASVYSQNKNTYSYNGNEISVYSYFKITEPANIYGLYRKQNYVLDYYVPTDQIEKMPILDMRYQYTSLPSRIKLDGEYPTKVYADDLSSVSTYTTATMGNISAYNGTIASNPYQAGLKAGYIMYQGEKMPERILYNGNVYLMGNFIEETSEGEVMNSETIYNDLCEITKVFYEYILEQNPEAKNGNLLLFMSKLNFTVNDKQTGIKGIIDERCSASAKETFKRMFCKMEKNPMGKDIIINSTDLYNLIDLTSTFVKSTIVLGNNPSVKVENVYKDKLDKIHRSNHYLRIGDLIYYKWDKNLSEVTSIMGVSQEIDIYKPAHSMNDSEMIQFWNKLLNKIKENDIDYDGAGNLLNTYALNNDTIEHFSKMNLANVTFSGFINSSLPNQEELMAKIKQAVDEEYAEKYGNLGKIESIFVNIQKQMEIFGKFEVMWYELTSKARAAQCNMKDLINHSNKTYYFIETITANTNENAKITTSMPFSNSVYKKEDKSDMFSSQNFRGFKLYTLQSDPRGYTEVKRYTPSEDRGIIPVVDASCGLEGGFWGWTYGTICGRLGVATASLIESLSDNTKLEQTARVKEIRVSFVNNKDKIKPKTYPEGFPDEYLRGKEIVIGFDFRDNAYTNRMIEFFTSAQDCFQIYEGAIEGAVLRDDEMEHGNIKDYANDDLGASLVGYGRYYNTGDIDINAFKASKINLCSAVHYAFSSLLSLFTRKEQRAYF